MSRWQTFRVYLKGEDEPVTVETNARDMATVVMDPTKTKPLDMTFQIVHAALLRQGVTVPRDYNGFLEVLDGVPESIDAEDTSLMDPTDPDR